MKKWQNLVESAALLAACALAYAQQSPSKAEQRVVRPLSQEQAEVPQSLSSTEAALRSELQRNPDAVTVLYQLALVLRQENKPRESLEIYTRAASLAKPDAIQLRSVAQDYVLLNDYDDAIHWLRVALGLDARNPDILYSLGRCFYTQNQFPEAEAAFVRLLQINPDHLKGEENLGLTYDAENKPKDAEKALRTAATWAEQRSLHDEWPFLDLGVFLLDQERADEAIPFLLKATAIAPNCASCHTKLGHALVATGKAPDGVKELQIAVQLDPENPKTHFELGHAYREAGDQQKARVEFEMSKSLYGEHNQN
jgi:tetratricopeptide (TPR) repeat protein